MGTTIQKKNANGDVNSSVCKVDIKDRVTQNYLAVDCRQMKLVVRRSIAKCVSLEWMTQNGLELTVDGHII